MKRVLVALGAFVFIVSLVACVQVNKVAEVNPECQQQCTTVEPKSEEEKCQLVSCNEHEQPESTRAPVRPAEPERSFETGEIVGEALGNAWTDMKSFGQGVWSQLKSEEVAQ